MKKLQNKKGFTLTEMIVVLAIIGILIALIAPNVARLIKSAQTTADTGKAKVIHSAALAYATDAIAAGHPFDTTAAPLITGTGSEPFAIISLTDANDTAMKAAFYGATPATGTPEFKHTSGNAAIPGNTLKGSDKAYIYMSSEGAAIGVVYTTGSTDKIKAVAGNAPNGANTLAPGKDFATGDLRDKHTFDATTGKIQ